MLLYGCRVPVAICSGEARNVQLYGTCGSTAVGWSQIYTFGVVGAFGLSLPIALRLSGTWSSMVVG